MRRKLIPSLAVMGLVAAACGPGDVEVSSPPAEELGFIRQVVDATMDSGSGLSISPDAEGNPHLAYLRFEREDGEQLDPLAPGLPTVMHAHLVGDVWTRTPVAEEANISREDETAIAVDAEGTHHVAWTQGAEVVYSSNAGGDFSEPERVFGGAATGLSIAAGGDGTPYIAFSQVLEDPEGPASLVRVATPTGEGWDVQTAAEAGPPEPLGIGIGVAGGEILVGYGDSTGARVARSQGEPPWTSETADPGGGLGVAMALDGEGTPHLSSYDGAGAVRTAGGAGFEVEAVGEADAAPEADWSTSVAPGPEGALFVAWQSAEGIRYASNAGGSFETMDVRGSAAGTRPRLAPGPEGDVFLAWYDTEELQLIVAVRTTDDPLLAAPPEAEGEAPEPGPTPGDGDEVEADVSVSLRSFEVEIDPTSIGAGETAFGVTVEDSFHNFFVIDTDQPEDQLPVSGGVVELDQLEVVAEIPDGFSPDEGIQTVSGTLEARPHVLICNIPGHYEQGMHTTLTVE